MRMLLSWDKTVRLGHVDLASALSLVSIWLSCRNAGAARLTEEVSTGPGGKPSSSKHSHQAVVGSRQ